MATRIFLGLMAVVWLPYGLVCLLQPETLEAGGLTFASATGSTEVRAMYGGLQAALGTWAAYGAWRPAAARPVLLALAVLTGGLASARLLGVLLDGGVGTYTGGALVFELVIVAASSALLRGAPREPAA